MQRSHFGVLCVKHYLLTARGIPSCFWLGQHFLWICTAPNSAWRKVTPAHCLGLTQLPHIWERLLSLDYGLIYLLPCVRWGSMLGAHQPVFLQLYWLIPKSDCPPFGPYMTPAPRNGRGHLGSPVTEALRWHVMKFCGSLTTQGRQQEFLIGVPGSFLWHYREPRQSTGKGMLLAGSHQVLGGIMLEGISLFMLGSCCSCTLLNMQPTTPHWSKNLSDNLCLSETFQLLVLIIKERHSHFPDSGVSNYISQYLQRSSWPAFVYTFFYVCFQVLEGKSRWLLK